MAEMKRNEKNGINRCPNCGASDVTLVPKTGKLKCNFCRSVFENKSANARGGVDKLVGDDIGGGAADIVPDEKIIVTLKCPACGAEVVINTDEAVSARCHWCRHTLSLNEKMPNGAVPDLVLPFKTEKSDAEERIREFVMKRQFFAHPTFRKEFTTENVMGVYMPYMVVDVNAHAEMKGEAEHLIRKYTRGTGNHKTVYYDAEAFAVTRDFDLLVDDLTIEASSKRLQQDVRANTNNVINAIMPFDTENCVDWNPNYLHGFASERRDTNVGELRKQLDLQVGDIARYKVKETMDYYDRGAKWTSEAITTKGSKWKAAYLPVWLYSYLQDDGKHKMLHYVAVNARTGETMGSVPINKTRLIIVSALLELLGIITGLLWLRFWLDVDIDEDNPALFGLLGLTPGFIFYWLKSARYRNMNARHKHEAETPSEIKNVKKSDVSLGRKNGLRNSRIEGENDAIVKGVLAKSGEKMMGERMANYLGIGRMAKSKASETAVGQQVEREANARHDARAAIVTIIAVLAVTTIVIIVAALVIGGIAKNKNGSSSGGNKNAIFSDVEDHVKDWAKTNTSVVKGSVLEIGIYNRNETDDFSIYNVNSNIYRDAFMLTASEIKDAKLTPTKYVTDKAASLDDLLSSDGLSRKMITGVKNSSTKYVMGLYVKENSKKNSYTFCDLREQLLSEHKTLGNSFTVELRCIEMVDDVIEQNDIKL